MSTDPSTIKPGGKVSVTLTDGTKIIDSPVTGGVDGIPLWFAGDSLILRGRDGGLRAHIASIDAYTPPTPEWDRPEVFAVKDATGDEWVYDRATSKWHLSPGEGTGRTAADMEDRWGPCTVLAVYADGAER